MRKRSLFKNNGETNFVSTSNSGTENVKEEPKVVVYHKFGDCEITTRLGVDGLTKEEAKERFLESPETS